MLMSTPTQTHNFIPQNSRLCTALKCDFISSNTSLVKGEKGRTGYVCGIPWE